MKYERLAIESGDQQTVIEFHPRLTVVTGLSATERDGLVGELIGALGSARPGVHLELLSDTNRRVALFRPARSAHRVVDVDSCTDVSDGFVNEHGAIDLLEAVGLDLRSARRLMRLSSQSLAASVQTEAIDLQLAAIDQTALWNTAELVIRCRDELDAVAEGAGTTAEDAQIVAEIERRHDAFERSQEQSEGVRKVTFVLAGLSALATLPVGQRSGTVGVAWLAAVAVVAVCVSIAFWRRTEQARRRETEALEAAGARSYLGFHLQRVNNLLASDAARQQLIAASERHHAAASQWRALAGDVDVDWVIGRRTIITTAARARRSTPQQSAGRRHDQPASLDRTAAILNVLDGLRDVGGMGESFPLIVDEAFEGLDPGEVPALLEVLMTASAGQQVILLTGSDLIENWAHVEAMTGAISAVHVQPTTKTTAT